MCSGLCFGPNIPKRIVTEEHLAQFCKLAYFWLVFLNSNNHNKEIKIHEYDMMSNWNMQGLCHITCSAFWILSHNCQVLNYKKCV